MSIELKQAAQQALSALEKSQPHPSNPVIGLTNQDFIDHEETIRQLRAAIQQTEAQQPATPEPVAWNSIQIASWIGSQLMHEPSMFERSAVCKFVRSLGRHPTLLKHSPKTHPAPSVPADVMWDAWQARATLAQRPVQVPMTDEEIGYWYSRTPSNFVFSHFKAAIRSAEAHHGITAQAKEAEAQQPDTGEPVAWPLRARVWKRESTQEWVLEIAGTLGDTDMNIRHTQPLSVAYENVPGLPAFYTRPAPSVPEGYALVPIEPTQAMLKVPTWDFNRFYSPREIWAAMLAAK